jgi:alpha-2-macroglobulin
LEHSARWKLIAALLCLAAVSVTAPCAHASRAVSFTLSTNRTFSPDEKPTLHLYTHNVDQLEFRIYRVKNPEKFILDLPELHSFGNTSPSERIDEETWLEKFHDWKHHLWFLVRHFVTSSPRRVAITSARSRRVWHDAAASWG